MGDSTRKRGRKQPYMVKKIKEDSERIRSARAAGERSIVPADEGTGDVISVGMIPLQYKDKNWTLPFLNALASTGNYALSCRAGKINLSYIQRERAKNPDFDALCKECENHAIDLLEAECMNRARNGYIEPEFYKGKMVMDRDGKPMGARKFDTTMAIFLLKMKRYNKQHIEISGGMTSKVEHHHTHELSGDGLNRAIEVAVRKQIAMQEDEQILDEDHILEGVFEDVASVED